MPTRKNLLLTAFALLTIIPAFAQRSSDLGVQISTNNMQRLSLQYRAPVGEQLFFRLGGSYGIDAYDYWSNGEIISASDSSVTERNYDNQEVFGSLTAGFEHQSSSSLFSFYGDVIVTYGNDQSSYSNSTQVLRPNGVWEYDFSDLGSASRQHAQVTRHFLRPGGQLGLAMNVPVGENFLLNLHVAGSLQTSILLAETDKINPLNEFGSGNQSTIDFNSFVGIGLRYKLPTKKAES